MGAVAVAIAAIAVGVVAGVVRWRVLLNAYGAVAIPTFMPLERLYFIAVFYNNYLPVESLAT